MNQKMLRKIKFPKFQLIPILRLQVMHDYVHWYCPINYCVKLILVDENVCKNCFTSRWNDFCLIPLGKCASWRRTTNKWNNSKFEIFQSTLYMKSEIWAYKQKNKNKNKTKQNKKQIKTKNKQKTKIKTKNKQTNKKQVCFQ